MSFDLAVWSSDFSKTTHRAPSIYEALCKGVRPAELIPSFNITQFYSDLTTMWPELDSLNREKADLCPWTSAISHSDCHVLVSCLWPRAEEVFVFMRELALTHQLLFFDPQSDEVFLPE